MLLVNGANGIGTGWSSQIPPHNPKDVIAALKSMILGETCPDMKPWYRGFTGSVTKIDSSTKWAINGVWSWTNATTLHVTELPVGTWTNAYKEYLEKGLEGHRPFKKDSIKEIKSNHTDTTVDFTIKLTPETAAKYRADQNLLVKDFKLRSTIDTGNMHAFDTNGVMKKFSTANDIMADYFPARLELYTKRKQYQITQLQHKLNKQQHKIRFITLVVNQELGFKGKTKDALLTELRQLQFPNQSHDYLLGMSLWNMTHDKIQLLKQERTNTQNTLQLLNRTSVQQLWLKDIAEIEKTFETRKRDAAGTADRRAPNKKRRR